MAEAQMADHGGFDENTASMPSESEDKNASQCEDEASVTSSSEGGASLESLASLETGAACSGGRTHNDQSDSSPASAKPTDTTRGRTRGGGQRGLGTEQKAKSQRAYPTYYIFNRACYDLMLATKVSGVQVEASHILREDPSFEPGSRHGRKSCRDDAVLARWNALSAKFSTAVTLDGQTRLSLGEKFLLYREEWNAVIEQSHGHQEVDKDGQNNLKIRAKLARKLLVQVPERCLIT
jgi:hypothetical protein